MGPDANAAAVAGWAEGESPAIARGRRVLVRLLPRQRKPPRPGRQVRAVMVGDDVAGPSLPKGMHLALTDKRNEMWMMWKTPKAFSFVPDAERPGSDETAEEAAAAVAVPVAVSVVGQGNGKAEEENGGTVTVVIAAVADDKEQAVAVPAAVADQGKRRRMAASTTAAVMAMGTQQVQ